MEKSLMSDKLRSVITLVDKLRDIKLQSYIKLPKIVAVGSQSSGKSSLVEQIVGIDFLPRGSGVVTRRPLQLRMVYQKELAAPYGVFAQIPEKKFTNFVEVKQNIEMLTQKVCGKNKNIIDNPIILDVYSAHCPNLTIIDLPGLTRIAIEGQDKNIHEVTTKMIKKYMEEPSTIILCVIPANQDITNDEVLHMARKIDVNGQRTIGCITKIDIMDRGTDARNLLLNKGEVPLRLGYIGIKNRSQQDINLNKSVQQSIQNEKMFFSNSPIYSSLPPSTMGTVSLVTTLTKVLTEGIVRFLPQLIAKIRERKNQLASVVESYGKPLPKTPQQRQSFLWQLCSQFINQYNKSLSGQIGTLNCADKMMSISTAIQNELAQTLSEQFNSSPASILTDQKIFFALRKFDGDNMPGFPSVGSFLFLLNPLLNRLRIPIQQTLNNVHQELNTLVNIIIAEIAQEYIELRQYIYSKVTTVLYQYKKLSNEYMERMMEAEIGYIYTNNPIYQIYTERKPRKQEETKLSKEHPIIIILRNRVDAYYQVVVKNLRDLIPKNIKYMLLVEATKKIEFQIFQTIGNSENHQNLLKIGENSKNQRIRNQMEFDIICKAEQFLLTHASFASYREAETKKRLIIRQKEIDENNQKRTQKDVQQKKQVEKNKKQTVFEDFFGKKKQEATNKQKQPIPVSIEESKNVPEKKKPYLAAIFGQAPKNSEPKKEQQKNKNQNIKDTYNKEMGKTTDKAVDQLYANKKFQDQSKKAVADGASLASQKQLGVSEETGNSIGKGAAWLFGQQAVQDHLREETKKNVRAQTQFPNQANQANQAKK